MAAEKKAATPTSYLVLRKAVNTDLPPDPKAHLPMSWATVNEVSATSATAAIRAVVAKIAEKDQAGTFVAVPARSWKPVTVNPQTTIRLELTEAKP